MFSSCTQETTATKSVLNFYESEKIFKIEPEVDWSYVTGRIILLDKTIYDETTKSETNTKQIRGLLYTDEANYVDGGVLKVYDRVIPINTIEKIYGFSDPINDLLSIGKGYADTMSIMYNGYNVPFNLSGSIRFEPLKVFVKAPIKKVSFIQPKNEEQIDTQKEFVLKWDSGNDTNSNIRLIISNGSNKQITIYGKDKGEYKIDLSNMEYLGKGKFAIEILSGNYTMFKHINGYYSIAIVGSSYQTTVYLK